MREKRVIEEFEIFCFDGAPKFCRRRAVRISASTTGEQRSGAEELDGYPDQLEFWCRALKVRPRRDDDDRRLPGH